MNLPDLIRVLRLDLPVERDLQPVKHHTYTGLAVDFLREIGIPVEWKVGAEGFLPFLEIEAGGLLVDPRCPVSNLLHEAGHIATMPSQYRHLLGGDISAGVLRMLEELNAQNLHPDDPLMRQAIQCGDPEATAWAYAAGRHLGIPAEVIILDSEYSGTGKEVRLMLSMGRYVGINGLQHAGFTSGSDRYTWLNRETYPAMAYWLQGGPAPAMECFAECSPA